MWIEYFKNQGRQPIMTWHALNIKIKYWLPSSFLPFTSFFLPSQNSWDFFDDVFAQFFASN